MHKNLLLYDKNQDRIENYSFLGNAKLTSLRLQNKKEIKTSSI